jgi:high-affinity Fe2+/Pb2+ permease
VGETRRRALGLVLLVVLIVLFVGVTWWKDNHVHGHITKQDAHDLLTCVTGPHPENC